MFTTGCHQRMWNTCHFMGQWPDSLKVLMQSGLGMDTETLRKPMGVEPGTLRGTCLPDVVGVPATPRAFTQPKKAAEVRATLIELFKLATLLQARKFEHLISFNPFFTCVKARCAYKKCRCTAGCEKCWPKPKTPKRRSARRSMQKSSLALRSFESLLLETQGLLHKDHKEYAENANFLTPRSSRRQSQFWLLSICIFFRAGRFFENITFTQGGVKNSVLVSNILIFIHLWGKNQFWLTCFKWVQTTNQKMMFILVHQIFWFRSITKQFWVGELSLNKLDSWRLWQPKMFTYQMGVEPIVRVFPVFFTWSYSK